MNSPAILLTLVSVLVGLKITVLVTNNADPLSLINSLQLNGYLQIKKECTRSGVEQLDMRKKIRLNDIFQQKFFHTLMFLIPILLKISPHYAKQSALKYQQTSKWTAY